MGNSNYNYTAKPWENSDFNDVYCGKLKYNAEFDIQSILKDKIPDFESKNYVFRGMSNSKWQTISSLQKFMHEKFGLQEERYHDEKVAHEFELALLNTVKRLSGKESNANFNNANDIETLALMQHYGLPTRLIDVSHCPLVALWFACGGFDNENSDDAVLLCFQYEKFKHNTTGKLENSEYYEQIQKNDKREVLPLLLEPSGELMDDQRIKNQKGAFLFGSCNQQCPDLDYIMSFNFGKDQKEMWLKVLIIPTEEKVKFRNMLKNMGIDKASLGL